MAGIKLISDDIFLTLIAQDTNSHPNNVSTGKEQINEECSNNWQVIQEYSAPTIKELAIQ